MSTPNKKPLPKALNERFFKPALARPKAMDSKLARGRPVAGLGNAGVRHAGAELRHSPRALRDLPGISRGRRDQAALWSTSEMG